jgi:hypothetical protein
MIEQVLPSIRGILGSASARRLDFGDILPLKANRTGREAANYVEIDRNTSYDNYEQTRRPLIVPPKFPSGKSRTMKDSYAFFGLRESTSV